MGRRSARSCDGQASSTSPEPCALPSGWARSWNLSTTSGSSTASLVADAVLVVGDDEHVMVLPPPLATLAARARTGPISGRPSAPTSSPSEKSSTRCWPASSPVIVWVSTGIPHTRPRRAIGKRRRGIAPLLERLVMEALTSARAQLDVSEVVNLLWIEQERLRGRDPQPGAPRYAGEFRRRRRGYRGGDMRDDGLAERRAVTCAADFSGPPPRARGWDGVAADRKASSPSGVDGGSRSPREPRRAGAGRRGPVPSARGRPSPRAGAPARDFRAPQHVARWPK